MTPIELNGKVFCSNCGLTIANNSPEPTVNTINPVQEAVNNVATNIPEEVEFPVIPEVVMADQSNSTRNENDGFYTNQLPETETTVTGESEDVAEAPVARKLEVITDDSNAQTESWAPITAEIAKDLGVVKTEPTTNTESSFESKISDLSIPSEEDFTETTATYEPVGSYVELANPGDEKKTLEASGILLDILGNEEKTDSYPSSEVEKVETAQTPNKPLDPIAEPEIPAETETREEDDIYIIPKEVKVGLRNKKVSKTQKTSETGIDPKTEKKIEKLEELIADIPEPVVSITTEEAINYDPDTIDPKDIGPADAKSKIIKDYFSTAIEKDKKTKKVKAKKKKQKKSFKIMKTIIISTTTFVVLAVSGYIAYDYFRPTQSTKLSAEASRFTTVTPTYIPEGYLFKTSGYTDLNKTFQANYVFANNKSKTIIFRQIQVDDSSKYISDYILAKNTSFIEKEVGEITLTEVNKNNLIWAKDDFVFVIETENYDLSNELLYKTAETVK